MHTLYEEYCKRFGKKLLPKLKLQDNFTTDSDELDSLKSVFAKGYLSLFEGSSTPDKPFSFYGGPENYSLETEWSDYYNIRFSVAVNSATSGLYAAIGALGIGYGDEVIVSPYTMSACSIAPLIYGAVPIFADIDPDTGCLDPESVASKVTERTKAILIVHQFGYVANMDAIVRIAKQNNLNIIEDCAQAHGAKYQKKFVGTIGDIGVFSLNVNKTIQSGEGGIVVTNNEAIYEKLCLIRNHGENVVESRGIRNIENLFGQNYRMTEVTASIARVQLKKLSFLNNHRLNLVSGTKLAVEKTSFLKNMGQKDVENHFDNTFYIFPFKIIEEADIDMRTQLRKIFELEELIFSYGYVKPLYLLPIFRKKSVYKGGYPYKFLEKEDIVYNYSKGDCPVAENLHFRSLISSEHIRFPNDKALVEKIENCLQRIESII